MNSHLEEPDLDILIIKDVAQHKIVDDDGVGPFFVNASNSQKNIFSLPGCFVGEQPSELLIEFKDLACHCAVLF